ncbi:MAG: hypothetical protein KDD83_28270, partial [Caldilineaceae bacterium]|nr:hypothetical protein [Caldilineaceae bacterium]
MHVKLDRQIGGRRGTLVLVTGVALLVLAACGRATPAAPPLATPIPTYTPNAGATALAAADAAPAPTTAST